MKKGSTADNSFIVGMIVGFAGIIVGYLLEGGSLLGLLGVSAFIIVFGGMSGALIVSFSVKDFLSMGKLIKSTMVASKGPTRDMVVELVSFAEKARREGLLALEDDIEQLDDKFLQKGIRMVVDGVDPEIVRTTLENDVYLFEHRKKEEIAIFEAAGGFCPTMGIIGTVTGLVLVLGNLGGDASALGHSIAAAFIATLYGIGLANILFLPTANKLKYKMRKDVLEMECIMTGLHSIQSGDNPALIKERLVSFLEEDVSFDEIEQGK